jgi:5-methylcytosine-specific restriction endonuclease McrA
MNLDVLVLNNDYEPLNVCNARRALVMIYLGKADVLHANEAWLTSSTGTHPAPSVVRLRHHVRRPLPELKLSRRTVFARDHYTCQYCGTVAKDLTIDHVIPKRLGGLTVWENLVTACRRCNTRKSDKPLSHSGMKLNVVPRRPRYVPYISLTKYQLGRKHEVWRDYLPVFSDLAD